MLLRRLIIYTLITFIFFGYPFTSSAQGGESWLQGNWRGKAYLLGNDPDQNYDLTLNITSIKAKKFEGTLKAAKSADTSVKFESKVSGIINDLYLFINIATWKVTCANCKPQNLAFSIESGKFVFKGEAKGCSIECTWITEFSKSMAEFDEGEQESLHTLAKEEITPDPESEPPIEDKKEEPVAIVPPPVEIKKEDPPVVAPPPAVRIPILAAGDIVVKPRNTAVLQPKRPVGPLAKRTSLKLKENNPPPPPERIPVLEAGTIVLTEKRNALPGIKQVAVSLTKVPSIAIRQNNPSPPPERIPILNAGSVVLKPENKTVLLPQKPTHLLQSGRTSLVLVETSFPIPERKVPATVDTIVAAPVVVKVVPPAAQKPPPVLRPDPVSLLPAGYAERKINVVRTLTVDTDSITLRVYDNGVVDGDIVSVVYNDKVIVDKLSLKSRALEIKIPVNKEGANKLVFYAHNLGEFPPNTAKLEILYGGKMEELTLSSDFTVSSAIDIFYKP